MPGSIPSWWYSNSTILSSFISWNSSKKKNSSSVASWRQTDAWLFPLLTSFQNNQVMLWRHPQVSNLLVITHEWTHEFNHIHLSFFFHIHLSIYCSSYPSCCSNHSILWPLGISSGLLLSLFDMILVIFDRNLPSELKCDVIGQNGPWKIRQGIIAEALLFLSSLVQKHCLPQWRSPPLSSCLQSPLSFDCAAQELAALLVFQKWEVSIGNALVTPERDVGSQVSLLTGVMHVGGEGNDNPLQYSCLENSMDRGAWWATVSPWGCKESDTTEWLTHTCRQDWVQADFPGDAHSSSRYVRFIIPVHPVLSTSNSSQASDLAEGLRACSVILDFTLCDPMDCSLPGSSFHGILWARIPEWVAISSSRGCSQPRDGTAAPVSSASAGWFFITATWEAQEGCVALAQVSLSSPPLAEPLIPRLCPVLPLTPGSSLFLISLISVSMRLSSSSKETLCYLIQSQQPSNHSHFIDEESEKLRCSCWPRIWTTHAKSTATDTKCSASWHRALLIFLFKK